MFIYKYTFLPVPSFLSPIYPFPYFLSNIQFNGILKLRKRNLDSKEKGQLFQVTPLYYLYKNGNYIPPLKISINSASSLSTSIILETPPLAFFIALLTLEIRVPIVPVRASPPIVAIPTALLPI